MDTLTMNQLVAWNLRAARLERGWKQDEAAERLEPYLGERWSRTTFSAAEEGTISGRRIRQFTANDVAAFAQAFEVPVLWFLMPPAEERFLIQVSESEVLNPEDYLAWLLAPDFAASLQRRIRKVANKVPHPSLVREWLESLDAPRAALIREVLNAHMLNVREQADSLRRMANDVEEALGELDRDHGIRGRYGAEEMVEGDIAQEVSEHPERYGETGRLRSEKASEESAQRRLSYAKEWIRTTLVAEEVALSDEMPAHVMEEIEKTLAFFSDVVPPPGEGDFEFVQDIREELARRQEEKGTA